MLSLPNAALEAATTCALSLPRHAKRALVVREALLAALPHICPTLTLDRPVARSPRDVYGFMAPRLEVLPVEEFYILILDTQHRITNVEMVTRGLLNTSLIDPREVYRRALTYSAAGIILCHNHPSGDPTPSPEDKTVTEQLALAGRLLGIPVFDHIIVGKGRYMSFAESGLL